MFSEDSFPVLKIFQVCQNVPYHAYLHPYAGPTVSCGELQGEQYCTWTQPAICLVLPLTPCRQKKTPLPPPRISQFQPKTDSSSHGSTGSGVSQHPGGAHYWYGEHEIDQSSSQAIDYWGTGEEFATWTGGVGACSTEDFVNWRYGKLWTYDT